VSDIARLDYSELPANYQLPSWVTAEDTNIAEVIKHAWRHFKAHNDPPGLEVKQDALFGWGFQMLRMRTWPTQGTRPVREFHVIDGGRQSALSAAWAWYDRRLALPECDLGPSGVWPRILTWSDEQVAAVERWLVDSTVEMPEVLRG